MDITVIIPTYKRPEILSRTLNGLDENLWTGDGEIRYLVGVDDEAGEESETVQVVADFSKTTPRSCHPIISGSNGLGHNLNHLLRNTPDELVFQMDDDHLLKAPLDLTPHARALTSKDERTRYGWIRLMFGHSSERSVWPRDYYRFHARLYKEYWEVSPGRDELWVVSNRPHLKHIKFHDTYGMYEEGVKLGETEYEFCQRWNYKAREMHYPGVFIPFRPPHEDTWDHIGESWQHTEADK